MSRRLVVVEEEWQSENIPTPQSKNRKACQCNRRPSCSAKPNQQRECNPSNDDGDNLKRTCNTVTVGKLSYTIVIRERLGE